MAKPFIKWAGGKTQLLSEIEEHIPEKYTADKEFTYVEPFVGGGSVVLHLLDKYPRMNAVINDLNTNLVNCYRVIQDDEHFEELKALLMKFEDKYALDPETVYKQTRAEYNERRGEADVLAAAHFIFLNKTCFNGIHRENSKGEFNVPWGKKDTVCLYEETNMDHLHRILKRVTILNGDYKDTLRYAGPDTLFYLDPPYRPVSQTSSFNSYVKDAFGDEQQRELKEFCDQLNAAGADFIESNSKSENFFEELYEGYHIDIVSARRNINSKGEGRGAVDEIMIYNGEKLKEIKEYSLF